MAEAEEALRELSRCTLHPAIEPQRPSVANEKTGEQSLISSEVPRDARFRIDRLRLDPDLDFVCHNDGPIELTEPGFRRMLQAHSAGLDVVIGIDGREVFRFLAPQPVHAPPTTARKQAIRGSLKGADIIETKALPVISN